MSFWSKIGRLFTVDDSIMDEDFSLLDDGQEQNDQSMKGTDDNSGGRKSDRTNDNSTKIGKSDDPGETQQNESRTKKLKTIKPRKLISPTKRIPFYAIHIRSRQAPTDDQTNSTVPEKLSKDLQVNRDTVRQIFHLPTNADVIIRDFTISETVTCKAFAVFMEGMSDKEIINSHVLQPLMILSSLSPDEQVEDRLHTVKEKLLPGNQVMEYDKWEDVRKNILSGSTAVFIDGAEKALIVETKGWEQRGVGETKTETVVRGPHDAFTENLRANTGLVRSRIRTEKLITEMMQVGELAPTDVAVMYVKSIVNPRLVEEVKRRIKAIKVDFLQDSGILEQFIEDPPKGLIPRMLATERPDRVAASLSEGFVAVFVGQSPYVLILPTVIWSLIHTAEDAYLRYPFGSLIRIIRFSALLAALLLPSLYIAITNYHPEMIPTDLMLAIAAARERVPFPVVLEVLLMELSLELIREAGIRIPNVIGPTIGIVGALILGQAAVQAGIISPLLVIVVAVTALSAFTMPNYNFGFAIRSLRFLFILLAAMWGFYGITLGILVLLMHFATLKSFGVPMLSPVAPHKPSSPDILLRGPVFKQEKRPASLFTQDAKRQRHFTRPWDPTVRDSEEAQKANSESVKGGNGGD
jgi:spore germination protein KA